MSKNLFKYLIKYMTGWKVNSLPNPLRVHKIEEGYKVEPRSKLDFPWLNPYTSFS